MDTTDSNEIKNLIKLEVISGFEIEIDFSKLKYKLYRLDINLNEDVKKSPINSYIIKNSKTVSIYETIGDAADIELEIIISDVNEIHELIEAISKNFPNSIKDYKYHYTTEIHKSIPIPEK